MPEDTARRLAKIRGRFENYPTSVVACDDDVQWMVAAIDALTAERDALLDVIESDARVAEVGRAFYDLTVQQRDSAWRECERKQAIIDAHEVDLEDSYQAGYRIGVDAQHGLDQATIDALRAVIDEKDATIRRLQDERDQFEDEVHDLQEKLNEMGADDA